MAYSLKYKIEGKRRLSTDFTSIHISQNNYGGSSTTLSGRTDYLSFLLEKDSVFSSTIGVGAEIRCRVNADDLEDLYTTDEQEFLVEVYNNDAGDPIYRGFVTSEIFNQDYSRSRLIATTIQVSDPMVVLNTIPYTATGSFSSIGTTTASDVIVNVLSKLNITYNYVYCNSTLLLSGQTSNHLFDNLKVNERNYFDENDVPMKCREVLDTILQPFGLNMFFRGNDIYIIDPLNLHSVQGKYYSASDFSYIGTASIGGNIDFSGTTLGYYETGQSIDKVPQRNSASIEFSSYCIEGFEYDFNDENNITNAGSYILVGAGTDYPYYYNYTITFKDWTVLQPTIGYQRSTYDDEESVENAENYIVITRQGTHSGTNNVFRYSGYSQYIGASYTNNVYIKISFDIRVNTHLDPNYESGGNSNTIINTLIGWKLKLGNKWIQANKTNWDTTEASVLSIVYNKDRSNIANSWQQSSLMVPINSGANGLLTIYLTDLITCTVDPDTMNYVSNPDDISAVHLKNIKLEYVDSKGKTLDTPDVKVTGKLDVNASNELETISTKQGTVNICLSKGVYRYSNEDIVLSGYTYDSINYYPVERILLQKLISQYKYPRLQLTAEIKTDSQSRSLDVLYNKLLISDNKYKPNKNMVLMSGEYNDYQNSIDGTFLEITKVKEPM